MLNSEALEQAKNSKSLTLGNSPFRTGVVFTVSDFGYESVEGSNNFYPVFRTSLGNLSVQSLLRAKAIKPIEINGQTVTSRQPEGTFHDLIRKILSDNVGKTNDEVLKLLVDECKDKKFMVRNREYVTVETKYGDRAVPLCHIDIVVE